tara:strand:+ start:1539 stop:1745 length:207 start_codon:yes stop_codon:yes gene_type:complete
MEVNKKMNIESAKYTWIYDDDGVTKIKTSVSAVIDGVLMSVPLDPANRHYQAILEWAKEDGNTIQEAD